MTRSAPSPEKILLVGAGFIAAEYVRALKSLGYGDIAVLSRREASAKKLAAEFSLARAYGGGESTLPELLGKFDAFIVAASIEALPAYAELLAGAGKQRVLLEKPSFLFSRDLADFTRRYPGWQGAAALNRLYYPSVEKLRDVMKQEQVTSAEFSFTEWLHRIDPAAYSPLVMERWGIANCIHVIATAFELIGLPGTLEAQQAGAPVAWHPAGSVFLGHGVSEKNIPFSYHADWNSAGRWQVTLRTTRGAYSLCPMEGVEFTPKGSVARETVVPPWSEPVKCGFPGMLKAWLEGGPTCNLPVLLSHIQVIEKIFGYASAPA